MKYQTREEPETYFKDHEFVECWSGENGGVYFEKGNRRDANKMRKRSREVIGSAAVVTVYPAAHDGEILITKSVAVSVAIGYMTGKNVRHTSLRD